VGNILTGNSTRADLTAITRILLVLAQNTQRERAEHLRDIHKAQLNDIEEGKKARYRELPLSIRSDRGRCMQGRESGALDVRTDLTASF